MQRRFGPLIAFVATLFAAAASHAALVAIDPVKVLLSGAQHSQTITLRNNGTERVRFQVTAFAWQQSPAGEMQLSPSQDIAFFPSLIEIAPGDTRRVRVAADTMPGAREKSYRLFVDELPSPNPSETGAIRVLTRFGLPVFVQPDKPLPKPELSFSLSARRLVVTLRNRGNAHFTSQSIRVVARDGAGTPLLQQSLPSWYILAGGERRHELTLTDEQCAALARAAASAQTDHGPARAEASFPSGACSAS